MRNVFQPPRFDQYRGESRFIYCDVTYEKKRLLGEGTTASVYYFMPLRSEVSSPALAVKMEHPVRIRGVDRFEEGVSFAIDADWNQQIHGLGVLSGDPKKVTQPHYLLMPYFEGVLAKNISLATSRELVEWFILVACFIHEKMHVEKQAVHGDIKMDNVIFKSSEKKAYVIDFGLTERIGVKIGPYVLPEKADPVLGVKKLSSADFCPQTPPELFGRVGLPAEPSQDAYGLGLLLTSLCSKVHDISDEHKAKINYVVRGLRAFHPEERSTIPSVIANLHADFIAVVPRAVTNKLELFRKRRAMSNPAVSVGIASEALSLPLLSKAMTEQQLGLVGYRTHLFADDVVSSVVKLPHTRGASAAPVVSLDEDKNGKTDQKPTCTLGVCSGSVRITETALSFFFALNAAPRQDGPQAKPGSVPDRHL